MNLTEIKQKVKEYNQNEQIIEGVKYLMQQFDLHHPLLKEINFREELSPNSILLTAEGSEENGFVIKVPKNILNFDLTLVINLLTHETLHLHQRSGSDKILERNEREWLAYTEMIFHHRFPQIPNVSENFLISFSKKALDYYNRMGENSDLQKKYSSQKLIVEKFLKGLETEQPKDFLDWKDFEKVDMRVGTILEANNFPKARNPSYQLVIDFGAEIGLKKSSAQITHHYTKEDLIGKQIIATVNFEPKQIANFMSECLVMGVYDDDKNVVLIEPKNKVSNGNKIG